MNLRILIALAVTLLLAACGGNDGPTTLAGTASKGPVDGAVITVFAMNADGSRGAQVAGPVQTDASGDWQVDLTGKGNGPFLVESSGGTFVDESSGITVNAPTMQSIMPTGGFSNVAITPLTSALVARIQIEAPAGVTTLDDVVDQVLNGFATAFGFDPLFTLPATPLAPAAGASTAELQYAIVLGAISHMLDSNPNLTSLNGQTLNDILVAIALDLSDLKLDGRHNGQAVQVGGVNLPALDASGLGAFASFITAFLNANSTFPAVTAPSPSFQQITVVNNTGGGNTGGGNTGGVCDATCQAFFARINGVNFGRYAMTPDQTSGSLAAEFDGAATYDLLVSSSGGLFQDGDSGQGHFGFLVGEMTQFDQQANETNVFYTDSATGLNVILQEDTASGDLQLVISEPGLGGANASLIFSNGGSTGGGNTGGGNTGGSGVAGSLSVTGSGTSIIGTDITPDAPGTETDLGSAPLPPGTPSIPVNLGSTYTWTQGFGGSLITLTLSDNDGTASDQVQINSGSNAWDTNTGGNGLAGGSFTVGTNTVTFNNVLLNQTAGGSTQLTINGTLGYTPAP